MILGLLFYYLIYPFLREMIFNLYRYLNLSFFIGIYAGLFGVDLWQSFDIAGRIRHFVVESEEKWPIDFESLKLELRDRVKQGFRNRTRFFFPFRGELGGNFRENLIKHTYELSKKLNPIQKVLKRRQVKGNDKKKNPD